MNCRSPIGEAEKGARAPATLALRHGGPLRPRVQLHWQAADSEVEGATGARY
jgi:hypothetical protein